MKKLILLVTLLLALNAEAAANKLVSTLPQTNTIRLTNYVMIVLQSGLSNQTFLVPWTNIAQQLNGSQVWTNDTADKAVYVVPHDSTNAMWVDQRTNYDGTVWVGRGAWINYGPDSVNNSSARGFIVIRQADVEDHRAGFLAESIDSTAFLFDNYIIGNTETNGPSFTVSLNSPTTSSSFQVRFVNGSGGAPPVQCIISNSYVFTIDDYGRTTMYGGSTAVGNGTNTGSFYVSGTLGIGASAISDTGGGDLLFQGGVIDSWQKTTGPVTNLNNSYTTGITNNGTNFSLGGFASYSTLATNAVTATGVTNTAALDRQAFVSATATSFTINDRSGAVLYTSPTLTATLNIRLQPGWSVRAASGLVGTVIP